MNAVLIHLGCQGPYIDSTQPPAYMDKCIEQYKLFNTGDLYVLTDRENIPHIKERPGVFVVPAEDYKTDKVDRFNAGYKYAAHEFWSVSTTRFFYLEEFIRKNKLAPIAHFENDVLVYFDLVDKAKTFKQLYGPNLAYTPCDDTQATSGFVYVGSLDALSHMCDFFVDMIEIHGMYGFEEKYKVHMTNDMTLLRRYADTRGAGGTHYLPVLPFGEFSRGYEALGGIFDPGDFGQYIGGTRGFGPGITYEGHIVGAMIRANPECAVVWKEENGLRIPYLRYNDFLGLERTARFNSLHIHSKNMEPFMSQSNE